MTAATTPAPDPKLPSSRLRAVVNTSQNFFKFMRVLTLDQAEAKVFYAMLNAHKAQPYGMAVHEIVDATGLTQPVVSTRLIQLRKKKFVESERKGQTVFNKIPDAWVKYLDAFVDNAEKRKV